MSYTENRTLSALDNAAAALSSAHMAAERLRARLGYLASPEQQRDLADMLAAIERAQQYHYPARREAGKKE
jgi:hypothetical protein